MNISNFKHKEYPVFENEDMTRLDHRKKMLMMLEPGEEITVLLNRLKDMMKSTKSIGNFAREYLRSSRFQNSNNVIKMDALITLTGKKVRDSEDEMLVLIDGEERLIPYDLITHKAVMVYEELTKEDKENPFIKPEIDMDGLVRVFSFRKEFKDFPAIENWPSAT